MTQEQYERACRIQDELISLNKMLYGFGNAKLIQINSINVYQRERNGQDYTMSLGVSQELSDAIVEVIKSRIEKLEEQFKNI